MPCTTILVGRKASYDGSTIIARNDDSGTGYFTPKKFAVVHPEDQPRHYRSVLSHVEVDLPDDPMRYTCMPNAVPGKGIWAAAGINAANVAMTATETITTNPRVDGLNGGNSVDANPYDQGAVVAQLALEQVPENGKVVVLNGPAGNFHSTARRDAWQKEFFDKREDVTIVAENIANWNKDEALKFMEDWSLANPQIDAIISMNVNMAAGALEAVKGKEILAYGVDGTPEATLLVEAGTMTATSLQNAQELAQLNMKTVHDLLTGAATEVNVDIGNPLITKDNAQEYIDMYKEAGLIKN